MVRGFRRYLPVMRKDVVALEGRVQSLERQLDYLNAAFCGTLLDGARDRIRTLDTHFEDPVFNPSLILEGNPGRVLCVARSSDIRHYRHAHSDYVRRAPKTVYAWYELDEALSPLASGRLDDSLLREKCPEAAFGIEDIRLFALRGGIWGIGAGVSPRGSNNSVFTQLLVRIDGHAIVDFHVVASPCGSNKEKNWTPFVIGDELFLVYSFFPLVVMKFADGRITPVIGKADQALPHLLRGGTAFIPWGRNYLTLVHYRPAFHPQIGRPGTALGRKLYTHSFLIMSSSFDILEVSDSFSLQKKGIEFAAGLADRGDDLLISYGVGDCVAAVASVAKTRVRDFLLR